MKVIFFLHIENLEDILGIVPKTESIFYSLCIMLIYMKSIQNNMKKVANFFQYERDKYVRN